MAALARRLLTEGRARLNKAPHDALVVLDLAADVLGTLLPRDAALDGNVSKERANALRLLGENAAALAALDAAEKSYSQLPVPAYDLAFVDWSRGTVYFALKQFASAREYLQRATIAFAEYDDVARMQQVRITEGGVLFDEGDVAGARNVFAEVLSFFERTGDEESAARLYANLSTCEIRLGDGSKAMKHAQRAVTLFNRHRMDVEAIRLFWSLSDGLGEDNPSGAEMAQLRRAGTEFAKRGLRMDAACVGLDVLRILLIQHAWSEARELAARLTTLFREEGATVDAAHAFAYLQEAIESASTEATDILLAVRAYVEAQQHGESRPFIPPNVH